MKQLGLLPLSPSGLLPRYERPDMVSGLDAGLMLDRQWHLLRGTMERTKEPTLLAVACVLEDAGVAYAIIRGVAAQMDTLPVDRLQTAGFRRPGRFPHSENWLGPDDTPVQFTDDPALGGRLARGDDRARRRAPARDSTSRSAPREFAAAPIRAGSARSGSRTS